MTRGDGRAILAVPQASFRGVSTKADPTGGKRFTRGLVPLCAMVFMAGCATPQAKIESLATHLLDDSVYQRVQTTFDAATFLKPRDGSADSEMVQLAPLIVQQTGTNEAQLPDHHRFGAVIGTASRRDVDAALPTVYYFLSGATIAGLEYRQLNFTWWYPPTSTETQDPQPKPHGLRITLDHDGFPMVGEVLNATASKQRETRRLIFISESLEREAQDAFGDPPSGRRHSIEQEMDRSPGVIVAGVFEDGPIPMGPFVYLSAKPHVVTALLCRCSPSQVDRFVETAYYDLRPLETLGSWGFDAFRSAGWEVASASPHSLESMLRWPRAQPAKPR